MPLTIRVLVATTFSILIGCDLGVQRGKCVVTAGRIETLLKPEGEIAVFSGRCPEGGVERPVLCLVVVADCETSIGGRNHARTSSSFDVVCDGKRIPIVWNRVTDKIRLQDKEFSRTNGIGILLVARRSDGSEAQQIKLPAHEQTFPELLVAFKERFPNEPLLEQAVARSPRPQ